MSWSDVSQLRSRRCSACRAGGGREQAALLAAAPVARGTTDGDRLGPARPGAPACAAPRPPPAGPVGGDGRPSAAAPQCEATRGAAGRRGVGRTVSGTGGGADDAGRPPRTSWSMLTMSAIEQYRM